MALAGATAGTMVAGASAAAAQTVGIPLYGNVGNREDLLDAALNLDKNKTAAVFVAAPKTTCDGLNHEWFTDTLPATSTGGTVEGGVWASSTLDPRVRLGNSVQSFASGFIVSLDQIEYSKRGRTPGVNGSEYEHQVGRFLLAIEQSIDARGVANGTSAGRASASAATDTGLFAGFRGFHGANVASGAAGLVVTAAVAGSGANPAGATIMNVNGAWNRTYFMNLHEAMFKLGSDPDTLAVDPGVKGDITLDILGETASGSASAAANAMYGIPAVVRQQYTMSSPNEFHQDIQFMRTPYGRVAVLVDRFMPTSTAVAASSMVGGAYFLYERSRFRFAFWRPLRHYALPPIGDATRGYVHCGVTTELLHPQTLGIGYGITT